MWFFDSRRSENQKMMLPRDPKTMKNRWKLDIPRKRQTMPLEAHVGSILEPPLIFWNCVLRHNWITNVRPQYEFFPYCVRCCAASRSRIYGQGPCFGPWTSAIAFCGIIEVNSPCWPPNLWQLLQLLLPCIYCSLSFTPQGPCLFAIVLLALSETGFRALDRITNARQDYER